MQKQFKNPFTLKQWGFIAHIKREIGEENFQKEIRKNYNGRHLMTLKQSELDKFIHKMFLKYSQ